MVENFCFGNHSCGNKLGFDEDRNRGVVQVAARRSVDEATADGDVSVVMLAETTYKNLDKA